MTFSFHSFSADGQIIDAIQNDYSAIYQLIPLFNIEIANILSKLVFRNYVLDCRRDRILMMQPFLSMAATHSACCRGLDLSPGINNSLGINRVIFHYNEIV